MFPKMVYLWEKFQHGSLKKWTMPFCVFATTFTIVMTILVLSIDLRGHHYIHFNASNILDFENAAQDSMRLITLIRKDYLQAPNISELGSPVNFTEKPPLQLLKLFQGQKEGTFIECGAYSGGVSTGTEWLERMQSWRGLLTQPHPLDYLNMIERQRPRSYTANVCISPTTNPKHASFRESSVETGKARGLTRVPCFPLFSLMLSYNTTRVDLLILNLLTAELQVLKTLPFRRIKIRVISIVNSDEEDTCCAQEISHLLLQYGYKQIFTCPSKHKICYFTHSVWYKRNLPFIKTHDPI